jgi:hypothetical protein
LADSVEACDLAKVRSPYLSKTFSAWRKTALTVPVTSEFASIVDDHLLRRFLDKVYIRYYDQLTQEHGLTDLEMSREILQDPATHQEFLSAADTIAQWSIEIELAVDVLDRAQLYGLYTVPEDLTALYTDLQREWNIESEPTITRMYRFLVHLMAYTTDKLTDLTKRHILHIAGTNIMQAKSAIVSGVIYAYMYGCIPWTVLALLGSQMGFVIGGWLVMRVGSRISRSVDGSQVRMHLNELKSKFSALVKDLKAVNVQAEGLIRSCLEQGKCEEKKAELANLLNGFLVKKQDESAYRLMDSEHGDEAPGEITFYEDMDWMVMELGSSHSDIMDY